MKRSELAQLVMDKLEEKGWTQLFFSKKLDTPQSYLSEWFNGVLKEDPKDELIRKIAKILEADEQHLIRISTRSKAGYSRTGGTLAIQEVFYHNQESSGEAKVFIEEARKGLSQDQWQEIMKVIKK